MFVLGTHHRNRLVVTLAMKVKMQSYLADRFLGDKWLGELQDCLFTLYKPIRRLFL